MKNLIIVESPSKTKTIEKYLGKEFKVTSSKGHIRDLATSGKYGFGVDIENNFEPKYKFISGKKKIVNSLNKEVDKVDMVYLATDPDREGEAISWHLKEALALTEKNYKRITFNEITKERVLESFDHARKIDEDLVRSQETRRILDRIIGFRLSKLMQKKIGAKSAGRVQSVALKLIVDREREIEAFIPEEYWKIKGVFNDFEAELYKHKTKKIEIKSEFEMKDIMKKLSKAFKIESIKKKERKRRSLMPFITSTLQQAASTQISYSGKKTMMLAQKLYEGIELEKETVGLITYMRTDSTRLSDQFIKNTYGFIKNKFGEEYIGKAKQKKSKNAQEAHEAIRPTDINRTPEKMKKYLKADQLKVYTLIYNRALASLMADAKYNQTTIILDNNDYKFKATGSILLFDGFLKVMNDKDEEKTDLSFLENYKSDVIVAKEIVPSQHFTEAPYRYTEARLIKELEESGIGRPSTYATIIDILRKRNYVTYSEKKFFPTEIGIKTNDKLQKYFNDIINVEYTALMENDLDKIALGEQIWHEVLKEFYNKFTPAVENAFDKMEDKKEEKTGEKCPKCGGDLIIKNGKYGKFVACSNFPKCKYIKQEKREEKVIIKCPNCEEGNIVEKTTRKGKIFYGCNNYPKCKTAYWDKPTDKKCPECKNVLLEKKDKLKCSNCDYEEEI